MKTKMFVAAVMLGVMTYGTAGAFGLPSFAKGASASAGDPDAFLVKVKTAEELVNKSSEMLSNLISSKEEKAKVETLKKQLVETTDAKEKNALAQKIRESQEAAICKAATDKSLAEQLKTLDDKTKQQATASLFNLALGAKMSAELVPEGQNLGKSIQSNPLLLSKAGVLMDAVKSLGGIASGTAKIIRAVPPVFTAAKMEVKLPTSSSDKAETISPM